jgi:alkylation response protein AidB-like acyl-CoA dehydrogenase
MDFTFDEAQNAVAEAAERIFEGQVTPDRIQKIEASDDRFDRELWAQLADADLLGLTVPEAEGGGGYGMVEAAILLEAQGRVVAPLPLWTTLVLGVLPLAAFASESVRQELLPGVVRGDVVLSAALADVSAELAGSGRARPAVTAIKGPGGVLLSGTASAVPFAHVADAVLVPATLPDGHVVLGVVDPRAPSVTVERAVTTNREIHPHLHLDGVAVPTERLLGGGEPAAGDQVLEWILERAWTGLCALQLGVCESAVAQTAEYLSNRQQFGRPLSTFQGTMLRVADAAIDTETVRVTMWQAAWRLDHGLDAGRAVSVASWFASDAGQRAVHATQHLHGGIGADVEYPIHRYFLWGKQIELMVGASSARLARLGRQVVEAVRRGATSSGGEQP